MLNKVRHFFKGVYQAELEYQKTNNVRFFLR